MLAAKLSVQLILTGIPMLFVVICAAVVVDAPLPDKLALCLLPLVFVVFSALFSMFFGVRNAILNWTNELMPIKQGGAVAISIFGGWGCVALFAAPYFFGGFLIGFTLYTAIWIVIFSAVSVLLYRWLITKGAKAFSQL